ncbi:MAG: PaaI family thioesterase [Actinomycetota bacterium]|nr:PaaI family thioesterase [Actinomycetota bacterium]MEC8068456.1 PaaI family thioesterase [Actinomycetota bacterium]
MSADTPTTETGGNLPPVEEASIYHLLKPEVLEHGDGRAVLRFTPEPIWTIGAGVVQGGIVTAMLDMAMAFASNGLSTATITVDILRPATGRLTATGEVTKLGRRLLFATGELHDDDGRLVARGNQTAIPPS